MRLTIAASTILLVFAALPVFAAPYPSDLNRAQASTSAGMDKRVWDPYFSGSDSPKKLAKWNKGLNGKPSKFARPSPDTDSVAIPGSVKNAASEAFDKMDDFRRFGDVAIHPY